VAKGDWPINQSDNNLRTSFAARHQWPQARQVWRSMLSSILNAQPRRDWRFLHAVRCHRACRLRPRGANVLVYPEEVGGIMSVLDHCQAIILVSECGPDSLLAFLHHEVDVGAASRVRMQGVEVVFAPFDDLVLVRRIGIHTDNDLCPIRIPLAERRVVLPHTVRGAVDGIKVHGGLHGRKPRTLVGVKSDGLVAQLLDEIGAPIPLQARRVKRVAQALNDRKRQVAT